ncbi:MAG: DNA methyltransferase [Fusobacterium mortiferum]
MFYPIVAPNGEEIYPIGPTGYESRWICGKEKYEELKKENLIEFQYNEKENKWQVMQKFYLEGRLKQPSNLWKNIEGNKKGTREIRELFDGNKIFDFPKPVQLILYALQLITSSSDIILDFFSGSATTAHAVMQLNAEDGGNRKYIMVQLPEVCDEKSEAYKAGYKNICEIGKERIRRAGEKIKSDETLPAENREKLDIGFKVFKLDSSNIKEWDSETENLEQSLFDSIDNIKSDRTSLDILYEILLKYGLDLNVPIVENKHFYSIGGGTLLISLDKEIDMEVIDSICEEYKTLLEIDEDFKTTVVFRDSSFANDVDKTNAMKKLEQVGIKEVRSI